MHQSILVKRKAEAHRKIRTATEALAKSSNLDPVSSWKMQPAGIHDQQVNELLQLEDVADVLMTVAIRQGAMPAPDAGKTETASSASFSVTATTFGSEAVEVPEAVEEAAEAVEEPRPKRTTSKRSRAKK